MLHILIGYTFTFMKRELKESDIVMTPPHIAKAVVEHFKPSGTMCDPCRGDGAFYKLIRDLDWYNVDWYEIREGKDFFSCDREIPYDWVISNPPYSIYSEFMRHTMKVAKNILYLIPANKVFNSDRMMREVWEWGGAKEMLVIGSGSRLKFPIGFCIAAVHFKRGWKGPMEVNFYSDNKLNYQQK